MLSIICVFNDAEVLKNRLLHGLAAQNTSHELITIDNVSGRFDSAAKALNWGAAQSHGDWIVFLHQDIELLSEDWIARAEKLLAASDLEGWAGVAGFTSEAKLRGIILDRGMLLGSPFEKPREVQTLDECLLIHRRQPERDRYFDEDVPGWHAYGVDACCAAIRGGATNYVLPLPVWHDSKSTNLQGLEDAHRYVWEKHGAALGRISTSCGDLPACYGWAPASRLEPIKRWWRRLQTSYYHRLGGYPQAFTLKAEELLESLTQSEDLVECLHSPTWYGTIEARGFVQHPNRNRRIFHRFVGWNTGELQSDCVVVAADLSEIPGNTIGRLRDLKQRVRRLIVCVDGLDHAAAMPGWREFRQEAQMAELTKHWDGTPSVILEC
ncbi:MAG: hypothetical protein QOH71_690 [Blastocatellia bacterium]|jgi:hypothetical protein|nr:hypothetical protein [Blastocatellia bacterium]